MLFFLFSGVLPRFLYGLYRASSGVVYGAFGGVFACRGAKSMGVGAQGMLVRGTFRECSV